MDLIGAVFLIGAVICLLLALQWGGTTYPWGDSKVWGNFLGFGLLTIIFIGVQMKQKERATIPLRILKQRTVAASAITLTCLSMGLYVYVYFCSSLKHQPADRDCNQTHLLPPILLPSSQRQLCLPIRNPCRPLFDFYHCHGSNCRHGNIGTRLLRPLDHRWLHS